MQQNPNFCSTSHFDHQYHHHYEISPHFPPPPNPNFPFHNNLPITTTNTNTNPNTNTNFHFPSQYLQDILFNSCSNSNNNSNNSTSDEAEDQKLSSLISERKQRRMISNRESARRSRMRKQKHLDELWSQVMWLRTENHQLVDKLNRAAERHELVLNENNLLKEEASELRQLLSDLRIHSPTNTNVTVELEPNITTSFGSERLENDIASYMSRS